MEHVPSQDQFIEVAPAAASIFSYIRINPALRRYRLDFEYAMVDRPSSRAVVKFACVNCPECQKANIWISAMTQADGTWSLTHTIDWPA